MSVRCSHTCKNKKMPVSLSSHDIIVMPCIILLHFFSGENCKLNVPMFSTVNPFAMAGGRFNSETDKLLFVNTPKLRMSTFTALISFLYLSTFWPTVVSRPGTRQAPVKHMTVISGFGLIRCMLGFYAFHSTEVILVF